MTRLDEHAERAELEAPARPRGRWVVLGIAIVMFVIGVFGLSFQSKLQDVQKNDNSSFLPGSADSTKVANAQESFATIQSIPGFIVYQRNGGLTAADKAKINADVATFKTIKGVAADQVGVPQFKSDVAATSVPLIGKENGVSAKGPDLVNTEKAVIKAAKANAPPGLVVHSAGAGGVLVAFIDAFSGLDGTLLLAAGLVVIAILLVVYRSPVLWIFPLVSAAVVALGASSLVIYELAKHGAITLNGQSQGILYVLVIGAGTDYALLFMSRYREALHEHTSPVDALIAAWRGTVVPIIASATTVVLGLLCLSVAELNSTSSLGPVCAIGIACTAVTMLTFLPCYLLTPRLWAWTNPVGWVLLGISFRKWRLLQGRWVFWPRIPRQDHKTDILAVHGMWGRFSKSLAQHYRRGWIGAGVLLLACVAGIFTLKTDGLPTEKGFTNKPEAIVGQQIYNANFSQGAGAPAVILVNTGKANAVIDAVKPLQGVEKSADAVCVAIDYQKITAFLKQDPAARGLANTSHGCAPPQLQVTPHDGRTLVDATLTSSYDSKAAYRTIRDIRATVSKIPGADALVGGQSAVNLDVQDASRHDRNLIIPIVLLVILVVLGLVLRALIAPILLIVTVVLSFAASLGVSALFFNHVFHFANADPAFPLFAFIFLVALGIDYNIFLMTRVREETLRHGTRQGIVRGLAVTGGVITSAGCVLAATFVVLGVLPIVFLAEVGFTVAFGVLLDTIVVRSILVPALGHEIGKKIWWPSRLAAATAQD
ncbi:MAG TPA: MMPL family transporter [Jatrophihabitans sp.]|nr:MMPL family transporter [Jatrophihabitans sp.]